MQKRVKLFLSLLCLPSLFSCNLDEVFANNTNAIEVMMSGTFQVYDATTPGSFKRVGLPTNAEDIIYRVEHGENVLFAFTKEGCSSCESFIENAGDYLWEKNYRISYIDTNTKEEAEKISNYAVEKGLERTISKPISGSTPSMYIMSKEKIVELIYGSTKNDKKVLATALKEYVKGSNVYHFKLNSWIARILSYEDIAKGPTYILSESYKDDFYTNLYPIVSKSEKKFNILELEDSDEGSFWLDMLYGYAKTEDVEGKLIDASWERYGRVPTFTVTDDAKAYIKENYVSSSL